MDHVALQLPNLNEFVDIRMLHKSVDHTFPTQESIKWFIRQHRDELAVGGALINVTGRLRFHPARFQQVTVEIGRIAAQQRAKLINGVAA